MRIAWNRCIIPNNPQDLKGVIVTIPMQRSANASLAATESFWLIHERLVLTTTEEHFEITMSPLVGLHWNYQ